MVAYRAVFGLLILSLIMGCGGGSPPNTPPSKTTGKSQDKATDGSPAAAQKAVADSRPPDNPVVAVVPDPKKDATTPIAGTTEDGSSPVIEPPADEPPFQLESGFTQLGFDDFEAFGAEAETWQPTADGVKCSGKPRGYLYSKQPFQNFTLRLDYRFSKPASLKDDTKFKGNTGFLIYITGEHKLWPVCLEVQGKHVQMGAIKENGGAQPVTATDDEPARQQARHAVGQWNSLEIVSVSGALSVALNGTAVSTCQPDFLSEGLIGIQAEDHPFEVRRLRIRRD
jgi:hypothetical protein